jgi:hypothetical protein
MFGNDHNKSQLRRLFFQNPFSALLKKYGRSQMVDNMAARMTQLQSTMNSATLRVL